jgi:biopolymer transport protein ExbB/TolQ
MTCKQLHRFLWLGWITLAVTIMVFYSAQKRVVKVEIEKHGDVKELKQQIQQLQVQQRTMKNNGN